MNLTHSVDTVVSTREQREKQGGDSAFAASQSPEKQSKDAAKEPASPTRPRSYPPAVGDNAKAETASGPSLKSSKPRPHSYPSARSKCGSSQAARSGTATAVDPAAGGRKPMPPAKCRAVHFTFPIRDYTHDIAMVAQSTDYSLSLPQSP